LALRFLRGLKANPAVGKLRRAFRRGAAFRVFLRGAAFRVLLRAAIFFPFFFDGRGFNPTIARCGFSMNGSPP
jgi:hypothetical protein